MSGLFCLHRQGQANDVQGQQEFAVLDQSAITLCQVRIEQISETRDISLKINMWPDMLIRSQLKTALIVIIFV